VSEPTNLNVIPIPATPDVILSEAKDLPWFQLQ
jgi:hypothetical protein